MQEIRIDNEQQSHPRAPGGQNNSSSNRIRQRQLTCYKCNKPDAKAVICSRDGPTRGGYCLKCFERYIGEFFRSGFLRQCSMLPFLQERDKKLLASFTPSTLSSSSSSATATAATGDSSSVTPTTPSYTPQQILAPSTKIFVAVSGSYNSMALLIQMALLNKEIGDKYKMITRNGEKLPPQGKNVLVRPFDLVVVHLTRFEHDESNTSDSLKNKNENNNNDDDDAAALSEKFSSPEEAESFRVEVERIRTLKALAKKLEINERTNFITKSVGEAATRNNNNSNKKNNDDSSSAAKELATKCFNASSSPHTQSNKALPLSVREDIYRCLIRNGLLNLAKKENAQVIALAQSATSSSWNALNDVTRGRGAGLFEANGYFCEVKSASEIDNNNNNNNNNCQKNGDGGDTAISSSSSSSTVSTVIKFIRPLVGSASRELTLFCTILHKNTYPEAQNCSVENPTSFSPAIPSIDRTLEDFVLNLSKTFASTSFNVAKSIEKVNAINFMRRIEGNEDVFMVGPPNSNNNTSAEEIMKQQEDALQETKNWKHCPLCMFSKVFDQQEEKRKRETDDDDVAKTTTGGDAADEIQKRNDVAETSSSNVAALESGICHGCNDSLILELDSLHRNLPAAGAKLQSGNFLELLKKYMKENLF